MSGHSKWANIKNRKGAQDKKRSEAFTKVSKNILTAIRMGGGNTNIESNLGLKLAIEKAKSANMPKENIERLLKNFESRKANLQSFMFEGYGPAGVPMMIEAESDNKNRTLGEIKFMMKDNGGVLGEEGSVAFQFKKVGEIELEDELTEEELMEVIDLGVEDSEGKVVYTEPSSLHQVKSKLEEMGKSVESAAWVMKPINSIMLANEDELNKVLDLVDLLEEHDDVIGVFAGFNYEEK